MFGVKRSPRGQGPLAWTTAVDEHVIDCAWNTTSDLLAVGLSDGRVTILDRRTGGIEGTIVAHAHGLLALAWQPQTSRLATAGKDGCVRIWERTGRELRRLPAQQPWVEHLAWNLEGTLLAASAGRSLHLWTADGTTVATLSEHPSTIADLQWKPLGNTLAALVYGGVQLWTCTENHPPTSQLLAWKGSPLRLAWAPDGCMLAHGNQDSTVHFWYVETAEELQMWGYPSKVRHLSWDATSRYLATGGGAAVCVWDCSGAGPANTTPTMLEGHEPMATLTALVYQRRGQHLASGASDGHVCLWQPTKPKKPLVDRCFQKAGEVTALAWSPADTHLAMAWETGVVGLWHL